MNTTDVLPKTKQSQKAQSGHKKPTYKLNQSPFLFNAPDFTLSVARCNYNAFETMAET